MNELRIILLLIGIAVIAFIYFWETLKQKNIQRSRVDNYHSTGGASQTMPAGNISVEEERELANFNLFLYRDDTPARTKPVAVKKPPPAFGAGSELWDEYGKVDDDLKPGTAAAREIIVIYITADRQPCIKGTDILKAVEAADMIYGNMRIFHNYGPDRKHAKRPLFSLANISEPGYFLMEDMQTFTTKGVALFLCLPAEMGGDIAFEFMLDAAHDIAKSLGGTLRGADHMPLDDDAINKLRVIASLY